MIAFYIILVILLSTMMIACKDEIEKFNKKQMLVFCLACGPIGCIIGLVVFGLFITIILKD